MPVATTATRITPRAAPRPISAPFVEVFWTDWVVEDPDCEVWGELVPVPVEPVPVEEEVPVRVEAPVGEEAPVELDPKNVYGEISFATWKPWLSLQQAVFFDPQHHVPSVHWVKKEVSLEDPPS